MISYAVRSANSNCIDLNFYVDLLLFELIFGSAKFKRRIKSELTVSYNII